MAAAALDGVRVIDTTNNVLGPLATQLLGDMGADVIKIEPPQGDPIRKIGPSRTPGMGSYFLNLNRNKRSVVLDLKRPAAQQALLALIGRADVLVLNMRAVAAARLGLDYPTLRERFPRLIHAAAGGFRPGSRLGDRPAFDDMIQGMSGMAALNGTGGAPRFVPTVLADKLCGHALAYAVVCALLHRERSGAGQAVHVPMLDTMIAFAMVEHLWGATIGEPARGLGYPRMLTPHRRPYATKDGYLCVIASTDDQWERLLPAIGRAELASDPRFARLEQRSENIDALYGVLAEAMRERGTAEWQRRLDAADIPNGPVNDIADLLDDDYLREVGFFEAWQHPTEGGLTVMPTPTSLSGSPPVVRRLAPTLGEHTREVLAEIGLDEGVA
ncbi:MAG: CoA transferase [Acidisphaera sp.]|nr:CoA transferase [Acidisphaera sp.]